MTSPSVETTNLHAALGGMSLQSASAENTPSPTAQPALPLEPNSMHARPDSSNEKATLTQMTPTLAKSNTQVDSSMPKPSISTPSNMTAPPRKKFVYDPTSMLLPHERLAQQRVASQSKPVSNGLTSAGNGQQLNQNPVQTHVMPQVQTAYKHHQVPPPPYSAVSPFNTSNGQMQAQQQIPFPNTVHQRNPEIGMPTRAAPPLPSSTNGTTAPRSKPNAQSVNRDTSWVDPSAVDPLHQGPVPDNNAEADDESELENEMGERETSRGKKRVRSEGTASVAGSVGGAELQRNGSSRGASNNHPALLSDWEVVETLGKQTLQSALAFSCLFPSARMNIGTGTFGRVLLVRVRPPYRAMSYHPIFPKIEQPRDPNGPTPAETAEMDKQLPHYALKVLNKAEIVRLKQVEHINSERSILERVRHPFLVEL
jgi:protein kinase A